MTTFDKRLLRLPDVLSRIGIKRSTLYRWIAEKKFPAPLRIGDRASAWLESDVATWINRRVAERDAARVRPAPALATPETRAGVAP
jgi:prophage regulatory protein